MFYPFTTKQTTPGQLLVFIGCIAVVLLAIGVYLLYLSIGQPPEKLDMAMQARSLGIKITVASLVVGGVAAVGGRWLD